MAKSVYPVTQKTSDFESVTNDKKNTYLRPLAFYQGRGDGVYISIATYNEKDNIEKLIREIFGLGLDNLAVIIIDDNSPDGTAEIVENLKTEFPRLTLIKRSGKLGYGSAHVAGFKLALDQGAEIIISMDADFSHSPKKIPELVAAIEGGNDVAIGSRKIPGGELVGWGLWRKFCSTGAMLVSQAILGIKTNDLTSGFRAYGRWVFDLINLEKIKSDGYSFLEELIYLIEKTGLKIKEVPISFLDRRLGQSKLSKKEIIKFFITIFKIKFNSFKNFKFNLENLVIICLAVSFFIGIWHAFPMLKVIGDEMYFVGGVLRAMENFTILPAANDVPYGTLTYYLNYVLIGIVLVVMLPFFKFRVFEIKEFLIQSPELFYLIPRLLSAILALVLLALFNKIFKKEFADFKVRAFLLILLFTNMITVLFLHTGKMWVLSTLLVLFSFYYLYRALIYKEEVNQTELVKRSILISIIFAFLATANFMMNAFCFINIPLIILFFRRRRDILNKLPKYILIGLIIFILIILSNAEGIKNQVLSIFTDYHPLTEGGTVDLAEFSLIDSLLANLKKIFVFFPLMILTLLLAFKNKIKNRYLFILALVYFAGYFLSLTAVGTWSNDVYEYIRRLLPFGFFLILIIASFNLEFRKTFYVISLISLIYFGFTLYYLSAPTTYNEAYTWVLANLNQPNSIIINEVRNLELPKNKNSYLLIQESYCASKCQNVIESDLNNYFKPLIIDKYTEEGVSLPKDFTIYSIRLQTKDQENQELLASFTNPVEIPFAVDGHMANYFDFDFFRLRNFGPNIYVYKDVSN